MIALCQFLASGVICYGYCCKKRHLRKSSLQFPFFLGVLCFQMHYFRVLFFFTTAVVKCGVAAVKHLPILPIGQSVDYFPFGSLSNSGYFENRMSPMTSLADLMRLANYIAVYEES